MAVMNSGVVGRARLKTAGVTTPIQQKERGVLYNSNNSLYVALYDYRDSKIYVTYCTNPDDAWLLSRREFEVSAFCRLPQFHFRAHSPREVVREVTQKEIVRHGTK